MGSRNADLPQQPKDDRPHDTWICGHAAQGCACPHGPTPRGQCQGAMGGCQPIRDGQRIRCGRPACLGGPCDEGPGADGACGLSRDPCQPRRSFQAKWKRAIIASAIVASLLIAVGLFSPDAVEIVAPGPLSSGHRQILGSEIGQQRCAACHPGAPGDATTWFLAVRTSGHSGVRQTDLCLNCHHQSMPRETARNPHGIALTQLAAITERIRGAGQPDHPTTRLTNMAHGNQDLACATCHREHHGADPSFTRLSDAQCQTCHTKPFASFTSGHPDWDAWPYTREHTIRFDHRTHQQLHFPNKQTSWNCRDCHDLTPQGELTRGVSFEKGCSSCHDASMRTQAAGGFALFQLPSIDLAAIQAAGATPPPWPESANGLNDFALPPLMRLLLASDNRLAEIATELQKPIPDPAAVIVWMGAITRLSEELASDGQAAIIRRMERLPGTNPKIERRLSGLFPIQLANQAPWMDRQASTAVAPRTTIERMAFNGDTETDSNDLLDSAPAATTLDPLNPSFDPLLEPDRKEPDLLLDPVPHPTTREARGNPRLDVDRSMPEGGWYRDDVTLAIRYRPTGHADPRLQALIELSLSASLTAAAQEPTVAGAMNELRESAAAQACLACHAPQRNAQGDWEWVSHAMTQRPRGFTRFSHRPHLHQPQLSDCTHCHAVNPETVTPSVSLQPVSEFLSLERASCASCHRAGAAGDQCIQCHRYHVELDK